MVRREIGGWIIIIIGGIGPSPIKRLVPSESAFASDYEKSTHVLLKFWISPCQFIVYITGEVLKTSNGECCQFLACLIAFWMKLLPDGKEGDYSNRKVCRQARHNLRYLDSRSFSLITHQTRPLKVRGIVEWSVVLTSIVPLNGSSEVLDQVIHGHLGISSKLAHLSQDNPRGTFLAHYSDP